MSKGKIYCACDKADHNCYLTCAKGRKINPHKVYIIPAWKKSKEKK